MKGLSKREYMDYLENLNDKQREAVLHTEGPLLVLAGAGSGKTSTMTRRIAHLIKGMGVSPYNILAVTFTNKAANEMKERIESLLDGPVNMWIMTFHAACLRILRKHADVLGYTSSFVVYDSVDQKTLVRNIMKEYEIDEKKFPIPSILSAISSAKEEGVMPYDYQRMYVNGNFKEEIIGKVYENYQKILKKNNAMDFDDLLLNCVRLFEQEPEILYFYQDRFHYIMVDEYQDTNKIQYKFIKALADKNQNICVVGDDDQCIYQWRGADISNILNFERDFNGAKVIKLEQNYRSTGNILAAAHSVIKNNTQRKNKQLWTDAKDGNKIVYARLDSDKDEALYIAQEIGRLKKANRQYKDFAILYRTNSQSRNFEEALGKRNIPYRVVGGTRYYDRLEIKDMVAYMRLVSNPFDELALQRVINSPKRGIGPSTMEKLKGIANTYEMNLFEILMIDDIISTLSSKAYNGIKNFVEAIYEYHKEIDNLKVSDIYDGLLARTGYLAALEEQKNVEAEVRIENLMEFKSVIYEFEKDGELTLQEFLERIALLSDVDNHNGEEDAVALMTMHSAKGLEFPFVFIPGMEDGLFPGWRSRDSILGLEEERRLCYVGMTRAKERLCLTSAVYRTMFGKGNYTSESQFLRELDPHLMEGDGVLRRKTEARLGEHKHLDGYRKPENSLIEPFDRLTAAKREVKRKARMNQTFNIGERVKHSKFGEGTVAEVNSKVVVVNFDSAGIKKLAIAVAPLEKI